VRRWCGQWPREAARAITTEMAGRLTVKQRAQFAARYEVWNSVVAVQRWLRTVKGRNTTIRPETIKNCHSKLLTTGSVTDARTSGRPSTSGQRPTIFVVIARAASLGHCPHHRRANYKILFRDIYTHYFHDDCFNITTFIAII